MKRTSKQAVTHQGDVSRGGGGGHVQAGLLDAGGAVERARERAHRARDHQELVRLPVREPVRRRPHQRLQLRLRPAVVLALPHNTTLKHLLIATIITFHNHKKHGYELRIK